MAVRISTGEKWLDALCVRIESFFRNNRVAYYIDGRIVQGYRCPDGYGPLWLRDHVHQMKAFRYWEPDMVSALDYFAETQGKNGRILDCYDWRPAGFGEGDVFYDDQSRIMHRRCSCESDVEYHMVDGVFMVWQATGDDEWLQAKLPCLEKALAFIMSNPQRWDPELGLVKRQFTIDTWDFVYKDMDDKMCIMHGDNSGYYRAFQQMAAMVAHVGRDRDAERWQQEAEGLRERTNRLCWNGRFYTHQVHLDPVDVPGVDETEILSLSNTYDINRGLASHEQACSIIREYQRRRTETAEEYFAEWFSIHPPIPDFQDKASWSKEPGNYVNGGVMPLVGGELARACFEHGFEDYGLDILRRYSDLIERDNGSFLWYHPDGEWGISPPYARSVHELIFRTDGWGSGAFANAVVAGLAGVEDRETCFRRVRLSPRWVAAGVNQARVDVTYAASGAGLSYRFLHQPERKTIEISVHGDGARIELHLLLPHGAKPCAVTDGEKPVAWNRGTVEDSVYVDACVPADESEIVVSYS